jgi:hypothetical protein
MCEKEGKENAPGTRDADGRSCDHHCTVLLCCCLCSSWTSRGPGGGCGGRKVWTSELWKKKIQQGHMMISDSEST